MASGSGRRPRLLWGHSRLSGAWQPKSRRSACPKFDVLIVIDQHVELFFGPTGVAAVASQRNAVRKRIADRGVWFLSISCAHLAHHHLVMVIMMSMMMRVLES